ncbi:MAG TPA: GIY-YIG nuclease family protein [Thermomicrobiales bacterium]|nr:GIY-YIG nuclease family protein [Thermomicrobiales bacterium]
MERRGRQYWVYIMANLHRTIYVGVTNNLQRRVLEHKRGTGSAFVSRYGLGELVYYEEHRYINDAIDREKQIKGWTRAKKTALIESMNPLWDDFAREWE